MLLMIIVMGGGGGGDGGEDKECSLVVDIKYLIGPQWRALRVSSPHIICRCENPRFQLQNMRIF